MVAQNIAEKQRPPQRRNNVAFVCVVMVHVSDSSHTLKCSLPVQIRSKPKLLKQAARKANEAPRRPSAKACVSLQHQVPVDFCVQQDTLSENVSTEHVDFLLARQQWRKMEEEVGGHPIPKPGLRAQGSFQGTHSTLYPPTRSPRLKRR